MANRSGFFSQNTEKLFFFYKEKFNHSALFLFLPCILEWGNVTSTGSVEVNEFKIHPNPAKDYIQIELPNNDKATGSITSVSAKRVREFEGAGNFTVSTSNIDSGCYGVRIVYNNKVYQSTIVIQD